MKKLKKCLKCPYYLGVVKCVVSPCKRCMTQKRKKHPFPDPVLKRDEIKNSMILRKSKY